MSALTMLKQMVDGGIPVIENKTLPWGKVVFTERGIHVDSVADFKRRLAWAMRDLAPPPKSNEPAVAVPW